MADIFISYKREDVAKVHPLVNALRDDGLSVWWDQDIAPDAPWETTIELELSASNVTIVAWSRASVLSENVKAEARQARNAGKLIQTYVEVCNAPLFFGERQGIDLLGWSGDTTAPAFHRVLTSIREIIGVDADIQRARPMLPPLPDVGVVNADRGAAVAFADRGRRHLEEEDYDEAIVDFDQAVRRDASILEELRPEIFEAYSRRGRFHLDNWDYEDALDDFMEARRCEPTKADDLNADIVEALIGRGRERIEQSEFEDAFDDFEEAISIDPKVTEELKADFAEAYKERLRSYLDEEDYARAIQDFRDAVRHYPDLAETLRSEIMLAITAALEC